MKMCKFRIRLSSKSNRKQFTNNGRIKANSILEAYTKLIELYKGFNWDIVQLKLI